MRKNPHNPDYDATRIINGRRAGGIQHKLGPNGIRKAINKIEARKPGSASKATFRVPADRFEESVRAAGGRTRVKASDLTTAAVGREADVGLREVWAAAGRQHDHQLSVAVLAPNGVHGSFTPRAGADTGPLLSGFSTRLHVRWSMQPT